MSWDWVISAFIILAIGFGILSKMTGLTITEILNQVRDFFSENGGEVVEQGVEIYD